MELTESEDSDDVMLRTEDGDRTVHLNAEHGNLTLGGHGSDGDVFLDDGNGTTRIHLDANSGDIKLSGADGAEAFDASQDVDIDPGTVLVMADGFLEPSTRAYDSRVAGVVSGAGAYRPDIRLDSTEDGDETGRAPVALVGKVVCKVDASEAPIEVGDMLTTADTPGCAMKATDRSDELFCPFTFEVQWVENDEHHDVQVVSGRGRSVKSMWFTTASAGVAAHEYGHMLGHADEYEEDPPCPDRSPVNTGTIMDNNSANVPSRLLNPFAVRIGTGVPDRATTAALDPPASLTARRAAA